MPIYMHLDISIAAKQSIKTLQKLCARKRDKQKKTKLRKKQLNIPAQNDKTKHSKTKTNKIKPNKFKKKGTPQSNNELEKLEG